MDQEPRTMGTKSPAGQPPGSQVPPLPAAGSPPTPWAPQRSCTLTEERVCLYDYVPVTQVQPIQHNS